MPVELQGARVLLTGATGGIGQAIARALHGRGAQLILTGRKTDVLDELAGELGERAETRTLDLSDASALAGFCADVGHVDILVANAGLPGTGTLEDYSPEQVDRVLDVNLRAPVHMTRALMPGMVERGRGHLVYISSISGKVATARASLYNGTKFGLRGFAYAVREDLRGTGVGVTTVFPGFISDAGMWADAGIDLPRGVGMKSPEQVATAVIKGIEKDKAEIDVAPLFIRFGGWLAGPAPNVVTAISKRGGGDHIPDALADAQREKR
ncbi:MAG TPA: SDR family NAD(P)-dependent oxidoreductase [Thermoleophilaceae bacterium]|nr:SDR family NAD(P)-dependent oxidoreductase [Thermoleophilaceae bacterium]